MVPLAPLLYQSPLRINPFFSGLVVSVVGHLLLGLVVVVVVHEFLEDVFFLLLGQRRVERLQLLVLRLLIH